MLRTDAGKFVGLGARIDIDDALSPSLQRVAQLGYRPVLEAIGLQVVAIAMRSFNEPAMRAAPWAPLKPETIAENIRLGKSTAILKRDVVLARAWRVTDLQDRSVTAGTDRPYASFHQTGTRRGLPARPMLPFLGATAESAVLVPWAREKLERIGQLKLESLLRGASGQQ